MDNPQPAPRDLLPPHTAFLKYWMLSIMLSCISYGIAFTLFWACMDLMRTPPRRHGVPTTRRTRTVLMLYSVVMILLSTANLISNVIMVTNAVFAASPFYGNILGSTGTICLVFSSWGADGFLLSRCFYLYEGISRLRWRIIYVIISILSLMAFAAGMICLVTGLMNGKFASITLFAFECTSLFVNIVIMSLIVARLVYFITRIKASLGSASISIYTNIIAMLVESAALTIVFGVAYLVLTLALPVKTFIPLESLSAIVPMMSLTHIYVIAPLLIIYRVGHGKAWSSETASLYTSDPEMGSRRQLTSIRFADINEPPILMLPITDTCTLSLEAIHQSTEEGEQK